MSLHILGADIGRAIQIRVNNPLDLAKAQGGTAGAIAAFAVPKTVENKVMTTMKFIENHINVMMDIWGGVDAIKAHAPPIIDTREGDARLQGFLLLLVLRARLL